MSLKVTQPNHMVSTKYIIYYLHEKLLRKKKNNKQFCSHVRMDFESSSTHFTHVLTEDPEFRESSVQGISEYLVIL